MATTTVPEQSQALVKAESSPLFKNFADQYQLTPKAMVDTLLQTVFPHGERDPQPTWAQLAMFMSVAQQYKLNPFTRQIYAFPDKNGGVVPIVPIDGWVSLIQREKAHDGLKFTYHWDDGTNTDGPMPPKVDGKAVKIAAITAIIYRKDQQHTTEVTEFLSECFRNTNPWQTMTIRMLRHKALMQCGRYAYGLGGIYDEDEARDIIQGGELPVKFDKDAYVEKKKAELTITAEDVTDASDGLTAQKDESQKILKDLISGCKTATSINALLPKVKKAPDDLKMLLMEKAKGLGLKFDKQTGEFFDPSNVGKADSSPQDEKQAATPHAEAGEGTAAAPAQESGHSAENPDSEPESKTDITRVVAKVQDVERRKKGQKEYVLVTLHWTEGEDDIDCPVADWHRNTHHAALLASLGKIVDVDIKRNVKDEQVWYSLETIYTIGGEAFVPPAQG